MPSDLPEIDLNPGSDTSSASFVGDVGVGVCVYVLEAQVLVPVTSHLYS